MDYEEIQKRIEAGHKINKDLSEDLSGLSPEERLNEHRKYIKLFEMVQSSKEKDEVFSRKYS